MFSLRARVLYAVYYDEELKSHVEDVVGIPLGDHPPLRHRETDVATIENIVNGDEVALPPQYKRSFCGVYCRSLFIFFATLVFLSSPVEVFVNGVFLFVVVYLTIKVVSCCCRCMCGTKQDDPEVEENVRLARSGYPADVEGGDGHVQLLEDKNGAIFVGVPVTL